MMFTLITISILGATITGIICDTFGQLRDKKDAAVRYRKEYNFVNNIPCTPSDAVHRIITLHAWLYVYDHVYIVDVSWAAWQIGKPRQKKCQQSMTMGTSSFTLKRGRRPATCSTEMKRMAIWRKPSWSSSRQAQ